MARTALAIRIIAVSIMGVSCLNACSAGGFTVRGRVVNESGEGIAGARVCAFQTLPAMRSEIREMMPVAETETDQAGGFTLLLGRPLTRSDNYVIVARHPDYGMAWRRNRDIDFARMVGDSSETLADFSIVMPERASIRGRVTDPGGNAVPDAIVLASLSVTNPGNIANPLFLPPCEALLSARTDADGRFVLDSIPAEGTAILRVSHPDYSVRLCGLPQRWEEVPGIMGGEEAVRVTLEKGSSVTGSITFEGSGSPAVGARVEAFLVEKEAQRMSSKRAMVLGLVAATTDQQGRYVLRVPQGEYGLQVTYPDWTAKAKQSVKVAEGARVPDQDFVLTKGVLVLAKFVNEKTSAPVKDGYVLLRKGAGLVDNVLEEKLVSADENGTVSFRQPPGEVFLYGSTESTGFVSERDPRLPAYVGRMLVAEQDSTEMTFTVTPWWDFEGKVVGPRGKAIPGADVCLLSNRRLNVTTGEDGTFQLALVGVPPSRSEDEVIVFEARHPAPPGYRGFYTTPLMSESDARGVIEMKRTGALEGRVLGADRRPIASAEVHAMPMFGRSGGYWKDKKTVTDKSGVYEIQGLAGDVVHRVELTAPGHGMRREAFRITEGKVYRVPDLVLEVADMTITGTVVNEDGEPVVGARVSCHGQATGRRVTTSDAQGRYRLENLVKEEIGVFGYKQGPQGSFNGRARVMAGNSNVEIVLGEQPRIVRPEERQARVLAGKQATELDVAEWVNGEPVTLASLRGKPVVVAFWDSADEACADLLRLLNDLPAKHPDIEIVSVHSSGADPDALKKFISDNSIAYRVALDKPADKYKGTTFEKYRVKKAPAIFIIDTESKLRYQDIPLAAVEQALKAMLGEN